MGILIAYGINILISSHLQNSTEISTSCLKHLFPIASILMRFSVLS